MTQPNLTNSRLSSLEEVAQQFEQWRAIRAKRGRIPNELWALVGPLMNQYGHNKIASALKVNNTQLKEHALPFLKNHQQKPTPFVECPLPIMPMFSTENCTVEITCTNGSTVKINGLTSMQIQSLIPSLIGN
jgi:hypothetical protein